MARSDLGSLTKEPPLSKLDATLMAISPDMPYEDLRRLARTDPDMHGDAPGLLRKRFLVLGPDKRIIYDRFLSLVRSLGPDALMVRKVMYFLWAYRDPRIRDFVLSRIARPDGKWRVSQVANKANASFFEKYAAATAAASSAAKIRSNFERFLIDAQLYEPDRKVVNLGLTDGWLTEALRIAAQTERDRTTRQLMTASPITFVIQRRWQGLTNATVSSLQVHSAASTTILDQDYEAAPEGPTTTAKSPQFHAKEWNRSEPASGAALQTMLTNPVARERALKGHYHLERLLADLVRQHGHDPRYTDQIDLFFETDAGTVIVEIKTCHASNVHNQIRKGISQLLEYRFLFADRFRPPVTPLLLLEAALPAASRWLIDFATSLGVTLAWREIPGERLVTTAKVPQQLAQLVAECL